MRACVVRLLGQTAIDEDESLRIDVQTDALIADTWPADPKAREAVFRRAGVKRKRMRDVIREIFFRPRAVYDQDDVMQMLGISDRMFADIVNEGELRRTMARSLSACC